MKRLQQLNFEFAPPLKKDFGGSLLLGKRKTQRPLSFKKPMHFVLKSSKAKGVLSFVNYRWEIEKLIRAQSEAQGIKIYDMAVNFNHIHILLQLPNKESYQKWIRLLPAGIVKILKTEQNFFDQRPYSKIVEWGPQFENALNYQLVNQMEIVGLRPSK